MKNKIIWKYGLALGFSLIALNFLSLYYFRIGPKLNYLIYIILLIGLPIAAVLNFKKVNNSIITYSDAFKYLFRTYFIGYVLHTVFGIYLYLIYDPTILLKESDSNTLFQSEELGLAQQYAYLEKILVNGFSEFLFMGVFGSIINVLFFLILAMILSLFLRTKTPKITTETT